MRLLVVLFLVSIVTLVRGEYDPEDLTGVIAGRKGECRIIAVGDVHGDLEMLQQALIASGVIDSSLLWAAGCSTLVQTGDLTDRGFDVLGVIDWLELLRGEAALAGGRVVLLNGNHELMNFAGDVRYVNSQLLSQCGGTTKYKELFGPSGKYGVLLRKRDFAASVNGTVFVHGGIRPEFAALGVAGINKAARDALARGSFFDGVFGDAGPLWTRDIIYQAREGKCSLLRQSLMLLGDQRMVVGHTPEYEGKVGSYCGGRLVDVDIAMSRAMGSNGHPGSVELLPHRRIKAFYAPPSHNQ